MNSLYLMNILFASVAARFAWDHEQAPMLATLIMITVVNLVAYGMDAYYDAKRAARRRS